MHRGWLGTGKSLSLVTSNFQRQKTVKEIIMFNRVYRIASAIICLSLAACGAMSYVPLDKEAKSRIQSVSVSETVPVPDTVTVYGMKQATAGVFGGVIGAAMGEAAFDDKTVLKDILRENDIRVGEILRSSFKARLEQSNTFPRVVNSGAEAQFNIVIENYGLFKRGAFDGELRAAIWGRASLVSADGKILWQETIKPLGSENKVPAHDLQYFREHPEALRESFKALAYFVAGELINDLNASSGSNANSGLNADLAQQAAPGQSTAR
jgi:hypothetical protein